LKFLLKSYLLRTSASQIFQTFTIYLRIRSKGCSYYFLSSVII
jgi:hypothetical protein